MEILRAHLLAEQRRDATDDAVADGVPERVVVPLEAVDVGEADRAPASALFEGEERFELVGEAAEVHQPRFRIAVRLVGGDPQPAVRNNARC
ncbi:MAG: hypothetical protein QM736_19710 [Vicinamibacterales bacterium]